MDVVGYIFFGIVFGVAVVVTYYLDKVRKRYMDRTVIHALERSIDLQRRVRDRFGWK